MLKRVDIHNFKSYAAASLKLAPLTVLIGANASGKSNAIEALRLLSWIVQGNRLSSVRYAVYEGEGAVRGTTATLARRGETRFRFGVEVDRQDWNDFTISIERSEDGELHIAEERLSGPTSSVPLYEVVSNHGGAGNDLRVAYNNFARGGKKPQVTCTDQMAVLLQMQSAARFEAGHKSAQNQIPEVCEYFQEQLGGILFLDPQPASMRGYSFKNESKLNSDGSNLSGVLYNICNHDRGSEEILSIIRSLPEQNLSGINFIKTPREEVMVSLEETFGSERATFDATLLSDGTLRVLSIAAAIHTAPKGSLLVIEEIDNGVHPSRAELLLTNLSRIAKDRTISILISSHNPALLDSLPIDAVPHVVFCYRDPKSGNSQLVQLQDVPDYPELIAQGSVGHLMTNGVIERFVKNHPGPEQRRKRYEAWLHSLQMTASEP